MTLYDRRESSRDYTQSHKVTELRQFFFKKRSIIIYTFLIIFFYFQDIDFSWPPVCTAKEEVTFEVPLSIHQTSKPVETTFTLNTRFFVGKEDEVTLTRSQSPDNIAFDEGEV